MSRPPIFANVGVKPQAVSSAALQAPKSGVETDSKKLAGVNVRTHVFSTRARWRSIDVYVQPPASMPADAFGRVWVYARTPAGRFLVSTGFFAPMGRAQLGPTWVCSASAECLSFEVDYQPLGVGAWVNDDVVFSYVASDVPAPRTPPVVGVVPFSVDARNLSSVVPRAGALPVVSDPLLDLEIVKVVATNTTAAQIWFQAVDAINVATAGGLVPVWSYGIPANASVALGPEAVSGYRFGRDGCVIGGSTTAGTFTAAPFGRIVFQVWIR